MEFLATCTGRVCVLLDTNRFFDTNAISAGEHWTAAAAPVLFLVGLVAAAGGAGDEHFRTPVTRLHRVVLHALALARIRPVREKLLLEKFQQSHRSGGIVLFGTGLVEQPLVDSSKIHWCVGGGGGRGRLVVAAVEKSEQPAETVARVEHQQQQKRRN